MENEKTLGERRVRTTFNPGNNDKVQNIKEKFAHLINTVSQLKTEDYETNRLVQQAEDYLETACMYAVKAATV